MPADANPSAESAVYAALGRRIRQARMRRGLTQEGLAALVTITRASIANIERGRQKFLVHTLLELSAALRTGPAELLVGIRTTADAQLDVVLKDRPTAEQEWIRSTVSRRGKVRR